MRCLNEVVRMSAFSIMMEHSILFFIFFNYFTIIQKFIHQFSPNMFKLIYITSSCSLYRYSSKHSLQTLKMFSLSANNATLLPLSDNKTLFLSQTFFILSLSLYSNKLVL